MHEVLLGEWQDRRRQCALKVNKAFQHGGRHLGKTENAKQTNAAVLRATNKMAGAMGVRPHFSEGERVQFIQDSARGMSVRGIAKKHGCSNSGVFAVLKRF